MGLDSNDQLNAVEEKQSPEKPEQVNVVKAANTQKNAMIEEYQATEYSSNVIQTPQRDTNKITVDSTKSQSPNPLQSPQTDYRRSLSDKFPNVTTKRIIFIRHAKSIWNEKESSVPDKVSHVAKGLLETFSINNVSDFGAASGGKYIDAPLSDEGILQSIEMNRFLEDCKLKLYIQNLVRQNDKFVNQRTKLNNDSNYDEISATFSKIEKIINKAENKHEIKKCPFYRSGIFELDNSVETLHESLSLSLSILNDNKQLPAKTDVSNSLTSNLKEAHVQTPKQASSNYDSDIDNSNTLPNSPSLPLMLDSDNDRDVPTPDLPLSLSVDMITQQQNSSVVEDVQLLSEIKKSLSYDHDSEKNKLAKVSNDENNVNARQSTSEIIDGNNTVSPEKAPSVEPIEMESRHHSIEAEILQNEKRINYQNINARRRKISNALKRRQLREEKKQLIRRDIRTLLGLEQDSMIVTSNLRRAIDTAIMGLFVRLQSFPLESIYIVSSLQEFGMGPDSS